jgi:DnaJ family protein A protein 2
MKTCAYQILGIPKNATDTEIKKAYRTQAVKCHPDKNPDNKQAEEEFKKLSEAYSILSDPQKKLAYDQFGWQAVSNEAQSSSANSPFGFPPDPSFFNMFFQGQNVRKRVQKPSPINESVSITFEELYCGFNKNIAITKKVVCMSCCGTGSQSKKSSICSGCNGQGVKVEIRQMGPIIQQLQSQCNICGGTGEVVDINDACQECSGSKVVLKTVNENISTKGSYPTGYKYARLNKGHELPTGISGDLFIEIKVSPNKNWKRENSTSLNIVHRLRTTLKNHYTDKYMYINHLDGSVLRLSKKNIHPKITTFVIPKMGLKDSNNLHIVGNLIVLIDIVFPEKLDDINNSVLSSSSPIKEENIVDIDTIIDANNICNQYFKLYDTEKIEYNNNTTNEERAECVQQ